MKLLHGSTVGVGVLLAQAHAPPAMSQEKPGGQTPNWHSLTSAHGPAVGVAVRGVMFVQPQPLAPKLMQTSPGVGQVPSLHVDADSQLGCAAATPAARISATETRIPIL